MDRYFHSQHVAIHSVLQTFAVMLVYMYVHIIIIYTCMYIGSTGANAEDPQGDQQHNHAEPA